MKISVPAAFVIQTLVAIPCTAGTTCEAFNPDIDGCSDLGIDSISKLTHFTTACDNHDLCYRTIGNMKAQCDTDFKSDMTDSCSSYISACSYSVKALCPGYVSYSRCLNRAEVYYEAVRLSSTAKKSYKEDQQEVTGYAEDMAAMYLSGSCSISSAASNLFSDNTDDTIYGIYQNLKSRSPSASELSGAESQAESDQNWEYTLINDLQ